MEKTQATKDCCEESYMMGFVDGSAEGFQDGFKEAEDMLDKLLMGQECDKAGYPWSLLRHIIKSNPSKEG